MGAARTWAPTHKSPRHRGEVTGAGAGGLRTQLPQDGSTCTFETPGFLLSPHSRRHTCLSHLSFPFTPNPVLTRLVDSGKPGLCRERPRDRAQPLAPRGNSKATPASHMTAIELKPSALGARFAPTLFIWREISMVYFGVFMLLVLSRSLPPNSGLCDYIFDILNFRERYIV